MDTSDRSKATQGMTKEQEFEYYKQLMERLNKEKEEINAKHVSEAERTAYVRLAHDLSIIAVYFMA